ncbi:hypothetical protein BaRGS_00024601 [Batillaria attramentaria]|uniref:DDE Tnp4 domain-containing protein n=1 Tax=Batillaria attramentaria TaxID=370345 RepID=A0ABD0KAQ1_9CAEN
MSSNEHNFYLIEFIENGSRTVPVVPGTWLRADEGRCWWPVDGKCSTSWVRNCKVPEAALGKYWPFKRILEGHVVSRTEVPTLLRQTRMETHFNVNGRPLCLYGDPAYPLREHLQRPYRGQLTDDQQLFNTRMSSVRHAVEWGFGKILSEFAFLVYKKNLKLYASPVGKLYTLGALLTN